MTQVKKFCLPLLAALALLLCAGRGTAQDDTDLRITNIDSSEFPFVKVRLLTRDATGAPISNAPNLVLRENRAPIPEYDLSRVPTGIDLVLVVDANDTLLQSDDNDEVTRRDKVAAAIEQFAREAMDPTGLDRVTVIAVDAAGNTAVLAEDLTRPQDLAEVIAAYQPQMLPRVTPLNDMLTTGLDHLAARQDDGRFQAILLFTDGARLGDQLAYQDLVTAAQSGGVSLFAAILGATADENEVANVSRLTSLTHGQWVHMPDATALDPLYGLFAGQRQQLQARYRSLVRQAGAVDVSVGLGNTRTSSSFELDLREPQLALDLPQSAVRRVGSAIDTPLPLLQPAVMRLAATISWPDGLPRDLTELAFLVNGRRQPLPANLRPDADGTIPLQWDISNVDIGSYELQVQARDELGFQMSSPPQTVTITIERPKPPTPTPVPTAAPRAPLVALPGGLSPNAPLLWALPVLFALVVMGALGGWWALRRARARRKAAQEAAARAAQPPPPPDPASEIHVPTLERLAANGSVAATTILTERDTLIGRDPQAATLVIDDPTVSRLHARLRQTESAEIWLYDEGSSSGTFLNHVRLGLAPRPVQHGDLLQFGRVVFRFTLRLPDDLAAVIAAATAANEPEITTQVAQTEIPSIDDPAQVGDMAEGSPRDVGEGSTSDSGREAADTSSPGNDNGGEPT